MSDKKMTVAEIVTEKMLQKIEAADPASWQRGWTLSGVPRNYVSNRPYSGINWWLLGFFSPYRSPYWMTIKQVNDQGGRVKKGEQSSICVFWKPRATVRTNANGVEEEVALPPIMRYYRVFNWEQTEGVAEKSIPSYDHDPIQACEDWIAGMVMEPRIVTRNAMGPAYSPVLDEIYLPAPAQFKQPEHYYKSRMHETVHWTGHPTRLNRDLEGLKGSDRYSFEELVAELGAAMFCALTGIDGSTDENSAAYLKGWLDHLQQNPTWIVKAAGRAQRALEYLRGGPLVSAPEQEEEA